MSIVIWGIKYQSADISFSGRLKNSGNTPIPAGALFGVNVHSDGVFVRGATMPSLPEMLPGGYVDVAVTATITGADPPGVVTARVGVISEARLLASSSSGNLAVIEAAVIPSGAITAALVQYGSTGWVSYLPTETVTVPLGSDINTAFSWVNNGQVRYSGHVVAYLYVPGGAVIPMSVTVNQDMVADPQNSWTVGLAAFGTPDAGLYQGEVVLTDLGSGAQLDREVCGVQAH